MALDPTTLLLGLLGVGVVGGAAYVLAKSNAPATTTPPATVKPIRPITTAPLQIPESFYITRAANDLAAGSVTQDDLAALATIQSPTDWNNLPGTTQTTLMNAANTWLANAFVHGNAQSGVDGAVDYMLTVAQGQPSPTIDRLASLYNAAIDFNMLAANETDITAMGSLTQAEWNTLSTVLRNALNKGATAWNTAVTNGTASNEPTAGAAAVLAMQLYAGQTPGFIQNLPTNGGAPYQPIVLPLPPAPPRLRALHGVGKGITGLDV